MQRICVSPQCLVPEGNWIKFTVHPLADRQFQKLIAMCYPIYQIRRHEEFLFLFVLSQLGRDFNGNQFSPIENIFLFNCKI